MLSYTVIETALMMSCIVVVYVGGWVNQESMLLWWVVVGTSINLFPQDNIYKVLYRFCISMNYDIHICINR